MKMREVPDYQTEIRRDNQKIVNTLVGTTEVKGDKKWDDDNNSQGLRPISIVVELYQNNQLFDSLEVTDSSNWQFEFTDLPKFDEEGKLYQYTIREIAIPDYETIYAEGIFDITNKLGTTETTSTTDSSSTTDTTSSQPKNSTDRSKKKDDLPQAGETSNTVNYIIGLLLVSSSLILLIKKREC